MSIPRLASFVPLLALSAALSVAQPAPAQGTAPAPSGGAAQPSADEVAAQAALNSMANAFVEAFQVGDPRALAAFWAPDADFVDVGGRVIKGRDAIEAEYAALFKDNKGLRLRIEVLSRRFPTPDTAIEDGVSSVIGPVGTLPTRSRYTNHFVRRNGAWLLASVREAPYVPPTNFEHLRGLDWTIGEWVEPSQDPTGARVVFRWTADRNFIVASRSVRAGDALLETGSERIGWDPAAKRIRSWSFEADGGFGEGTWTQDGDAWITRSSAVLSSGSLMVATAVVKRVDPDTITWQSTGRTVDGKPLPDSPVVTMKRVR